MTFNNNLVLLKYPEARYGNLLYLYFIARLYAEEHKLLMANINGIENRIEQIIANLLDNAISFSDDNKNVIVKVSKMNDNKVMINILDEGQGFKEKDTNKIFKRFYSNRPDKFGQHSGLGLNIVKNLVDLHNATIKASNRKDHRGANVEIMFPKV